MLRNGQTAFGIGGRSMLRRQFMLVESGLQVGGAFMVVGRVLMDAGGSTVRCFSPDPVVLRNRELRELPVQLEVGDELFGDGDSDHGATNVHAG
jgi:hypothetical protein